MAYDNIKLILAPMAGFSDQPFRRLCMEFGASEVVTELVSANALVRDNQRTYDMIRIHDDERPASVQIFGSDPDVMAEAATRVESVNPEFIDINMGCPAKKVVKNGAGAVLLDNPKLAAAIVKKVVDAAGKTPVSIKIRTGKNAENKTGMEAARLAVDSGAARITVHARTVSDGFAGPIDYDFVKQLKSRVHAQVIGNGGIGSVADARRWLDYTGCDGLMIGRGAIGHPSIFRSIQSGIEPPEVEEPDVVLRHCRLMEEYYGPQRALGPMRGHLMYYSKGIPTARRFRSAVNDAETFDELKEAVRSHFKQYMESVV